MTVPLTVQGQLTSPEQFAAIVLRANANGSKVVMGDVARVELGAQSYSFINRENNKAATAAPCSSRRRRQRWARTAEACRRAWRN
ncbi:efflux RND transporter permease subunit [Ralstonia solanacearum]|uniref:efflux RND transporter permease subunit n=1 Tax=Ralstonia solanacearum TaxID=305 RepID=UPI001FFC407B|nr:efflux RND transporter permease subunit [Ralstonia solanacearum]